MRRVHLHGPNGTNQYKHGISRRYLFLEDERRASESAGRNEFREIAFEGSLRRAEEPVKELDATLGTPYDDAYVRVKADVLKGAGIETLRILIESDDRNG